MLLCFAHSIFHEDVPLRECTSYEVRTQRTFKIMVVGKLGAVLRYRVSPAFGISAVTGSEPGWCRIVRLCFGRTSLLVSPLACAICSVTHFSCSNFLPVCFNGRDLPHSQYSPTVVLYFSLHQQAQWGQTRGNFSTSVAPTSSKSKHLPYPSRAVFWMFYL